MQSVKSISKVIVPSVSTVTKPKNTIRDKVKSNQFPKPHYEPRDIDKFNALDLIHLLVWWDEDSLFYKDGYLKLVTNDKCIVYSEGVYNRETHQVYNVIDTLKSLYELSFPKACFIANTFLNMTHYSIREYCEVKYPNAKKATISCDYNYNYLIDESLFKQQKADSFKRAYAVLHNRFNIDRHIVSEFIHRELLIMDDEYNLCFLGRDNYNVISVNKYLSSRDYLSVEELTLRRNAGFRYANKEETAYNLFRNVYVFENVIDLMSYLSLVKMGVLPAIEKEAVLFP